MNIFSVIILSAVEGLTEFLPVSSTGHLVLTAEILDIRQTDFIKTFEIFIQIGAITAVAILYFRRFFENINIYLKLLTAFFPTAIIGLMFYKFIKSFLMGNSLITVSMFFTGGIVLILLEFLFKQKNAGVKSIAEISFKKALIIGIFQALSVVPGVSRAGATIIGGMAISLDRKTAAEFSFLLAIPTIISASALDFYQSGLILGEDEILILSAGFILSFMTALLSVKLLLQYIRNHTFVAFGVYRILLAVVFYLFFISP